MQDQYWSCMKERVGKIYKHGNDAFKYQVSSLDELAVVINHFDKCPLLTQKRADYEL